MNPRATLTWLGLASLGAGCVAGWTLRTAAPDATLQWPGAPGRARVSYRTALSGVVEAGGVASLLKAIAIGSEEEAAGAFVLPVAVATARDGRLAVADLGRRCVHLYLPAEQRYLRLQEAAGHALVSPVGVAFDEDLRLYATDSAGAVLSWDAAGVARFALLEAAGERLQRPTGVAYGRDLLYVVDTLGHRVHAFTADGAWAFGFGGRGEDEGHFNFPTHAACSARGELYVTDALNFRVQAFDGAGHFVRAFGHHGDGSGDFALPKGIAVDRAGVVHVVDGMFDNVQLFGASGELLLTVGGRGTGFGEFWLPAGAFIDDRDDLYVCDTYNHRIQVFHVEVGHAE